MIGSKILSFMGQDVSSVSVDDVTNVITEASSPLDIIFVLTAAKQRRQMREHSSKLQGGRRPGYGSSKPSCFAANSFAQLTSFHTSRLGRMRQRSV